MRLDLAGEWSGHWWLPAEPDRKVPGVLRYEPGHGLRLSLIGGFEDRVLQPVSPGVVAVMEGTKSWSAIWGVAENKEITLLDCLSISSLSYGFEFDGPNKQTIGALVAVIGVHLEDRKQEVFTKSLVSVENLNQWAGSSVFRHSFGLKDERIDGRGSIFAEPAEEPCVVVDGISMTLSHEHTLPYFDERRGQTVGRMKDSVLVQFQPEAPFSLDAAFDHAKAIQDLVSLATYRACAILRLRLQMPPKSRDNSEGYPMLNRDIRVYFDGTVRGDADAKAIEFRAILFTCHHIPFEEIMPRWWQVRQTFLAAANMALGLRYAPARYIQSNLLTAVGAAEVMHRALGLENARMPKLEFDALRVKLLEQAPEEHRSWLKGLIRNDVTLRERLKALLALPDSDAMQRLVPDSEHWAKVATKARNDLAHTGRTPLHSEDELIAVVNVTSAVVVMNLLQALGVSSKRQQEVVNDHPELRQTVKHARQHLVSGSDAK